MSIKGKRVLVTGGAGFIGSHLVEKLVEREADVRIVDDLSRGKMEHIKRFSNQIDFHNGDLVDISVAEKAVKDVDICFHLAAVVGGVNFMKNHPAKMCKNVVIDYNILEACRQADIDRILYTSSASIYPISLQMEHSQGPLKEEDAFKFGATPDSEYGWFKLLGEKQCGAYHKEYGMKISIVRPFNPYGPRESFHPSDSHVIPAIIRRAVRKEDPFLIWGSGKQERAFTYISDLVEGMIVALMKKGDCDPINLGTDIGVSIQDLAEQILKIVEHDAPIICDDSKPEGVVSRRAHMSKVKKELEWEQKIDLKTGLKRTVDWYLNQKDYQNND